MLLTPGQLKLRLKFVEATDLEDRVSAINLSRRETNRSIAPEEDDHFDKFESFFDYEDELSGLKPAGEQFAAAGMGSPPVEGPFIVMTSEEDIESESFIDMEEQVPETTEDAEVAGMIEMEDTDEEPKEKATSFVRCHHVKDDGVQCKRQAPKSGTLCSSHRPKK